VVRRLCESIYFAASFSMSLSVLLGVYERVNKVLLPMLELCALAAAARFLDGRFVWIRASTIRTLNLDFKGQSEDLAYAAHNRRTNGSAHLTWKIRLWGTTTSSSEHTLRSSYSHLRHYLILTTHNNKLHKSSQCARRVVVQSLPQEYGRLRRRATESMGRYKPIRSNL
jgi:hypothetical protein